MAAFSRTPTRGRVQGFFEERNLEMNGRSLCRRAHRCDVSWWKLLFSSRRSVGNPFGLAMPGTCAHWALANTLAVSVALWAWADATFASSGATRSGIFSSRTACGGSHWCHFLVRCVPRAVSWLGERVDGSDSAMAPP